MNFVDRFIVGAALLLLSTLAPHMAFAQATAAAPPASPVVFRPGTAAGPFESAAAIADFDADGAPDAAIADRTSPSGSHYDIEVHLSQGSTQTVSFVSTRGELNVTALDVDDDHDADLVVTPVLSREVVGIWVNDGAGHFDADDQALLASARGRIEPVPALSGFGDHLIPVVPGRRLYLLGLTPRPYTAYFSQAGVSESVFSVPLPARAFAPSVSPRGPPSVRS